jgi:hypothetical protein
MHDGQLLALYAESCTLVHVIWLCSDDLANSTIEQAAVLSYQH